MIFNVQCTNTKIQMHKYNNTQIQLIIIIPIQIYTVGNIFQLNSYIGIGYNLQAIKNICQLDGVCAPGECAFSRKCIF